MYGELVGKYLNGYRIVRIEKDPFIKGQINLWTNEEKRDNFGNKSIVKFFIREESSNVKVYKELVDKEKYELQQRIDKAFYLLQILHYKFKYLDTIHNDIEEIQKILKEENNEKN